jgi:hypothetical protein
MMYFPRDRTLLRGIDPPVSATSAEIGDIDIGRGNQLMRLKARTI